MRVISLEGKRSEKRQVKYITEAEKLYINVHQEPSEEEHAGCHDADDGIIVCQVQLDKKGSET